jgi:PD-(D/E)XK endonuclease
VDRSDHIIKTDPRGQGDQGERSAIAWRLERELPVFLPIGHSRDTDLITVIDDRVVRVQVKTSTQFHRNRWDIAVCTRGGNRSWDGVVKYLDPSRFDRLFVLVDDGRRWFIPAAEVGAKCGLRLGGPQYERFEIEPGEPLRPPVPR